MANLLYERKEAVRAVSGQYKVELAITAFIDHAGCYLEKEIIVQLGEMGVGIGFDMYVRDLEGVDPNA